MNSRGDIAIADKNGRRIHLLKNEKDLTTIAGNGTVGFVRSALDALTIPIGEVSDLEWENDDTLVFSVQGDRPNIKKLVVGGRIDTIVGNSLRASGVPAVGNALETALNDPDEIFRLEDGRLAFVDASRTYCLNSDGQISLFESWRNVAGPAGISKYGDQYVMFSAKTNAVYSAKSDVVKVLAAADEVTAHTGGEPLKAVALDAGKVLYIATGTRIFQKDLASGSYRQLAGPGGLLLNLDSRDTSIQALKDIAFTPDGALALLEFDQVKVIPRSQHELQ